MEKGKQVPSEEVVGVTGIYRKLKTLNEEVRQDAEVCFQCHIPATLIRLALIVRIGKCTHVSTPNSAVYGEHFYKS